MAETATTRRQTQLAELLRLGRFYNYSTDDMVERIEKLYGKGPKAKSRAKSPAKS